MTACTAPATPAQPSTHETSLPRTHPTIAADIRVSVADHTLELSEHDGACVVARPSTGEKVKTHLAWPCHWFRWANPWPRFDPSADGDGHLAEPLTRAGEPLAIRWNEGGGLSEISMVLVGDPYAPDWERPADTRCGGWIVGVLLGTRLEVIENGDKWPRTWCTPGYIEPPAVWAATHRSDTRANR